MESIDCCCCPFGCRPGGLDPPRSTLPGDLLSPMPTPLAAGLLTQLVAGLPPKLRLRLSVGTGLRYARCVSTCKASRLPPSSSQLPIPPSFLSLSRSRSACFLFPLPFISPSALSSTTFAMRSNSLQTDNMRRTLPEDSAASRSSIVRKEHTEDIRRRSPRARTSCGFCKMLANSVTRAETG